MQSKSLRNLVFTLHRYLGLAVGLIAIIEAEEICEVN